MRAAALHHLGMQTLTVLLHRRVTRTVTKPAASGTSGKHRGSDCVLYSIQSSAAVGKGQHRVYITSGFSTGFLMVPLLHAASPQCTQTCWCGNPLNSQWGSFKSIGSFRSCAVWLVTDEALVITADVHEHNMLHSLVHQCMAHVW